MKIDKTAPSSTPLARPSKAGAPVTTGTDGAASTKAVGQVHALTAAGPGDFDAARVAQIREDIRAGRYQVNPEKIASGLLDSVRDMLGDRKKDA